MFIAAKLSAFVTQPLAWVAALLALAWALGGRQPQRARGVTAGALALLLALGWQPLPDALLRHLEAQTPPPAPDAALGAYHGVVVLGGALEPAYVWVHPDQPALNGTAERMTALRPLLARAPQLRVLFSGGEGQWGASGAPEAERARAFWAQQGLPVERFLFEPRSRTTFENARESAQLVGADKSRPWLLLTSAWHMPRALAAFRAQGWNVQPWPVDYRSGLSTPWLEYNMDPGVRSWRIALHEWVGLWAYRLSGQAAPAQQGPEPG